MKTNAFCGGELIANAFTEESSLSSQRRMKEKNQTTPTNQELKTAETETVILNPCSLLPSGNTNLIWIRHEDTFICLLKALYRVIQSWAVCELQGGEQYLSCVGRHGLMGLHLLVQIAFNFS